MEPLDPQLRRIIDEGMAQAAPGAEVEARVLAGLLKKLPGDGGGPDGDPGGGGSEVVGGGWKIGGGLVKALAIAGSLTAGGVAVAVSSRAPAPEVVVRGEERVQVVAPREQVVEEVEPEPVQVVEPVKRSAVRRTSAAPDGEDALIAETRGLAEAEAALARGEHARAVELAQALGRRFPGGQLGLEREAVEISGRCGLDDALAGEAAATFLAVHADAAVAGKVRTRCAGALRKKLSKP